MEQCSPINVNVTYKGKIRIQTVTVADAGFKREELIRVFSSDEVHEMGPWVMTTAGTAINVDANPVPLIGPQPPDGFCKLGTLWVDSTDPNVDVLRYWNGEEWKGISYINYEANAPGVAIGMPPDEPRVGTLWIDTISGDETALKYYSGPTLGWLPVSVGSTDVNFTARAAVEIGPNKPTENLVPGLLWVDTTNPNMVVLKYCDGTDFFPITIHANNVRVANI